MGAGVIAAVAAGSELLAFDHDKDVAPAVADGIVGAVLLAAAAIAWQRRPDSRVGLLMGGAGVAWFAGTLWPFAIFWHRGPLVHLHLSYPPGRLRWRPAVLTVAAVYAVSAIEPIAGNDAVTMTIATAVVAVAVRTFALASGTARRAGIPALVAAVALAGALSFGALNRQYGWQSDRQALWIYDAVIVGAVLILLVDLLRGRWADAVVTGFVVDLGRRSGTGVLRDELARALGDPSLTVGYWSSDQQRYVDDAGRRVDVDSVLPDHVVTPIDDDGSPVAVLVHDVAVLDDPSLVDSVTAAARLAVANDRLQADARQRVEELAASRRRLVEAADEQRRRIGHELRVQVDNRLDRAQALIAAVATGSAGRTSDALGELGTGVEHARLELDELARHPPAGADRRRPGSSTATAGLPGRDTCRARRLSPTIATTDRGRPVLRLRRSARERRQARPRDHGLDSRHRCQRIGNRRGQRQRPRRRRPDGRDRPTWTRRSSRGVRRPPRHPERARKRHTPHRHDPDHHRVNDPPVAGTSWTRRRRR